MISDRRKCIQKRSHCGVIPSEAMSIEIAPKMEMVIINLRTPSMTPRRSYSQVGAGRLAAHNVSSAYSSSGDIKESLDHVEGLSSFRTIANTSGSTGIALSYNINKDET